MNSPARWRGLATLSLFICLAGICRADVLKIVIDGPIHPIAEEYISRAVDAAAQRHASALLIEMRTPGGLADSTRNIIRLRRAFSFWNQRTWPPWPRGRTPARRIRFPPAEGTLEGQWARRWRTIPPP
jgi:hypothetical protein